jgi:N-methylhydantoinase A
MSLDYEAAERAILDYVANPLRMDVRSAAHGIIELVNNNMVGAVRVVSIERGYDPGDFTLVPFGGAGPLHSSSLAKLLGIKKILVPPAPGVLASLGLLVARLKADFSRTCLQHPPAYDVDRIRDVFADLEASAREWLAAENVPENRSELTRQASLRYRHQGNEIVVDWGKAENDERSIQSTLENFHESHQRLYTFAQRDTPVEIVSLHVAAIGYMARPRLAPVHSSGGVEDAVLHNQLVHFSDGDRECPVFDRSKLGAGHIVLGPAIVQQLDSTTLLLPGEKAEILEYGSMLVSR